MGKKLQVLVVFEFGGIDDPDSVEAEMVTDEVAHEIKRVVQGDWQSPMSSVTAWVQDATVVEEDDDLNQPLQAGFQSEGDKA